MSKAEAIKKSKRFNKIKESRSFNEGEGFKSNMKEDEELELAKKLDDIFFREDEGNLFSEPGEWGYLSSQHSLSKKVSPKQRAERIDQVIRSLTNYVRDLEGSKQSTLGFADNPDYDEVWHGLESDDAVREGFWNRWTKPSIDQAAHDSVRGQGYSHRGNDDDGAEYIMFDGERFNREKIVPADYNDMGRIPRVENGKLIIANPNWSL
jgi:hypothetical protein